VTELTTERLEEIADVAGGQCHWTPDADMPHARASCYHAGDHAAPCRHVLARALLASKADALVHFDDAAGQNARANSLEAERDAALARVGELEAALLPFAKAHVSAAHRDDPLDLHSLTNLRHPATHVSAADFKRASAALTPPEDPPA